MQILDPPFYLMNQNLRVDPVICVLTSPIEDSDRYWSLKTTDVLQSFLKQPDRKKIPGACQIYSFPGSPSRDSNSVG